MVAARQTVWLPLLFVHVSIDPVRVVEDDIVIEWVAAGSDKLKHLSGASRRDNGIGRRNSRYNVLDDALGEAISDALDVVLGGALERLFVDPRNVARVIAIDGRVLAKRILFLP